MPMPYRLIVRSSAAVVLSASIPVSLLIPERKKSIRLWFSKNNRIFAVDILCSVKRVMKNLSAVHFIPAKINVDSRLHVICLNEKNHLFCHSYGYDDGHGWMWLK